MTGDATPWQRVARLDATATALRLADLTGVRLTVEGPCPGGEVGAAYVRWPDGRRSVLTYGSPHAAPMVELARAAGVPAPRYELVAEIGGETVLVQECLPGTPPEVVDRALVEQMVALNGLLAGAAPPLPAGGPVDLYLTGDGPGFCLHGPLTGYDRRTREVLGWVREVGRDRASMAGDDLAHMDFHPGSVLVDTGRVTGVVDWDGACRGDGHFDSRFVAGITGTSGGECGTDRRGGRTIKDRVPGPRADGAHCPQCCGRDQLGGAPVTLGH